MPVRAWVRRFPREIAALPEIFHYVRDFAAEKEIEAGAKHDLDLVLEELFTNLVRHNVDGVHEIEVALETEGGSVRVSLRDFNVSPFDPTQVPTPDLNGPLEEQRSGGRGIHLVRRLTRDFHYDHRDGVSVITASLPLTRRQET
jgi:serine/threonine-protein kinase RsbW